MTVPATARASDVHGATCRAYLDRFAAKRSELPGAGLPWLDAWRARAIERFAEHGFPGPRLEEWKFTNISKLAETMFEPIPSAANGISREDLDGFRLEDGSDHLLVFVNGRLRPDLSDAGAPGDGHTSLRLAMMAALRRAKLRIVRRKQGKTMDIGGRVRIARARNKRQDIEIVWAVHGPNGAEIGKLTQRNAVPAGCATSPSPGWRPVDGLPGCRAWAAA